jgi:hypothetical protein
VYALGTCDEDDEAISCSPQMVVRLMKGLQEEIVALGRVVRWIYELICTLALSSRLSVSGLIWLGPITMAQAL